MRSLLLTFLSVLFPLVASAQAMSSDDDWSDGKDFFQTSVAKTHLTIDKLSEMDGTETGNGGFALFCKKNGGESYYAFYDTFLYHIPEAQMGYQSIILDILRYLKVKSPELAESLTQSYAIMQKNAYVGNSVVYLPDNTGFKTVLKKTNRMIELVGFKGDLQCGPIQMFARISGADRKLLYYIMINPTIFSRLTENEKAAAILHELIYDYVIAFKGNAPIPAFENLFDDVVNVNRIIFSGYYSWRANKPSMDDKNFRD